MYSNKGISVKKCFNNVNILICLVVFLFGVSSEAAPVGYWRFENSSSSEYNSPTVDAVLGTTSGYSTNVPDEQIVDGVSTYANAASYSIGASGTATTISDYAIINSAVCSGDFTI